LWNATEAAKPVPLAAATVAKLATVCPVTQLTFETEPAEDGHDVACGRSRRKPLAPEPVGALQGRLGIVG
jgi:hypothetical protein